MLLLLLLHLHRGPHTLVGAPGGGPQGPPLGPPRLQGAPRGPHLHQGGPTNTRGGPQGLHLLLKEFLPRDRLTTRGLLLLLLLHRGLQQQQLGDPLEAAT